MLLQSLEDYGITGEIWSYLTIRDIVNLLITNKQLRELCIRMNKLNPVEIDIRFPFGSENEGKQGEMFEKILYAFPSISKIIHYRSYENNYSGECNTDTARGKSLSVLYNNSILCKTMCYLSISVESYQGLIEIEKLKNLTSLDISLSSLITNDAMSYLISLTNLMKLNLSWCFSINDIGLSYLSSLVNLHDINISNCVRITNAGLSHLSPLKKLTSLNLSCLYISDLGLSYLATLKNMNIIYLFGCSNIANIGIYHLSSLYNLKEINITNCYVTDIGLSFLLSLANLESLSISWHEMITSNWFSQINMLTGLKKFKMESIRGSFIKDYDLSQDVIEFLLHLESFCIAPIRSNNEEIKGLAYVESLRKKKNISQI